MSTRWGQPLKGVQCYELFGGIALKNHKKNVFVCIDKNNFDYIMIDTYLNTLVYSACIIIAVYCFI